MVRAAICIGALCAAASLAAAPSAASQPRRATLVQGAEINHSSQDDSLVRRRLLALFPLGGPEAGLPAYLKAQGFKVRRYTNVGATGDQVFGEATLRWGNPISGRQVRISWRATKDGDLFEVGALTERTGLLGEISKF